MSKELRPDQMQTACGVAETLHGTSIGPHAEDRGDGMQKDYVVLTAEERAKGFVEPVRNTYKHLKCGRTTTMGRSLAETYARCPDFYTGTFCCSCGTHFPIGEKGEFVWEGTYQKVGTTRQPHACEGEVKAEAKPEVKVAPVKKEGELWSCNECGARWARWLDDSWSLLPDVNGKAECGKCCDNIPMPNREK